MFPEYLFLDRNYKICVAGKTVEGLLQYGSGFLQNKCINFLSRKKEVKSSLMIQIAKNFFEWKAYTLKAKDGRAVEVEICGFKPDRGTNSAIAMHVRCSRSNFPATSSLESEKIARWISGNLRNPLAKIQNLINLALINKNE
ncbi:MAG TPA: hypothetical protein VEB86_19530, partial [Chryseosolibacter sp.]|nr:hypothetical protein [Chryseosolibacter sp.]